MCIDYCILFSLSCNDDIRLDNIVTPQRRSQLRIATCSPMKRSEMSILLVQRNASLTPPAYPPDSWTQMPESQKSVLEKFLANFFKYPSGHLTGKTCARG